MLTQEQIDFYRENGFLVVEGVLRPDELQQPLREKLFAAS